jgi:hypothetical protein
MSSFVPGNLPPGLADEGGHRGGLVSGGRDELGHEGEQQQREQLEGHGCRTGMVGMDVCGESARRRRRFVSSAAKLKETEKPLRIFSGRPALHPNLPTSRFTSQSLKVARMMASGSSGGQSGV